MKTCELALVRYNGTQGYTAGKLYMDGIFCCYTLEDVVREVEGKKVLTWKVQNQTAIPRGRYEVVLSKSPKFKRILPILLDVEGFTGVRIHSGNKPEDTDACILVGASDGNDRDSWLGNSRIAESQLMARLTVVVESGKRLFLTVV